MPEQPLSPEEDRLRQALTDMIVSGTHPKFSPQDLWAAQGRDQLPAPPQAQRWDLPGGAPGDYAAMPQLSMNPRGTSFPQAMPSTQAPNPEPPPGMPRVPDQPQSAKSEAPFGGKGQIIEPPSEHDKAYSLPKKPEKKKARR